MYRVSGAEQSDREYIVYSRSLSFICFVHGSVYPNGRFSFFCRLFLKFILSK